MTISISFLEIRGFLIWKWLINLVVFFKIVYVDVSLFKISKIKNGLGSNI